MTFESRQKREHVYGDLEKMAVQPAAAGIAVKGPIGALGITRLFDRRAGSVYKYRPLGHKNRLIGHVLHQPNTPKCSLRYYSLIAR